MRMDASLQQKQELRLKLSPQMIQSIEILQIPTIELEKKVQQELLENPVLEIKQQKSDNKEHDDSNENPYFEKNISKLNTLDKTFKDYVQGNYAIRRTVGPESSKHEAMQNTPAQSQNLYQYLKLQTATVEDSLNKRNFLEYLIYNLNNKGYLQYPLADIAENFNMESAHKINEVINLVEQYLNNEIGSQENLIGLIIGNKLADKYLIKKINEIFSNDNYDINKIIEKLKKELADFNYISEKDAMDTLLLLQSFDPKGIGARNIIECLLLQLDKKDPDYNQISFIIKNFLEDISKNKLPKIAREMSISIDELNIIINKIRKLNPNPGYQYSSEEIHYIQPDVIVKEVDGEYIVSLKNERVPMLFINKSYEDLYRDKNTPKETKEFIQKKIESARNMISAIEQRQTTLKKVANEMMKRQKEFLEKGPELLKPMIREEIADAVGIHISTVSRAVANKYIQTPKGIYLLDYFFTSSIKHNVENEQVDVSQTSVINKIKNIINEENKTKPYSDDKIVELLKNDGFVIARRTVTKYRKKINIPSSHKRKIHSGANK